MAPERDIRPSISSQPVATGGQRNTALAGSNRILPLTRQVALFILPFLLAAWAILYLFPQRSAELFAWPVNPAMTARLMASGYLAGAYFFWRTATIQDWRRVKNGFVPVAFFAALMALSTGLHWDRFTPGHISFLTWVALYALTPLLVLGVWLRNRPADSGSFAAHDARVPDAVRWVIGLVGAGLALACLVAYSRPEWMIGLWPWTLTPLTARASLGFIILPAITEVTLARDPRWSTWRVILQGQIIALALILLAVVLSWADFNPANPATWIVLGGLGVILGFNLLFYRWMESRLKAAAD